MFDKLAIIDVETTGMSPFRDRVIEIGILRVEKDKVVESFESLVNPDCYLPPEITQLTGIHSQQLENAPSFYSLKDKIQEILDDAIFVAHNARFDYAFLKSEFSRIDISYTSKLLCTAKLSRTLYPRFRHHNLDSIIERFHIGCDARHRALGDAKVLWEFIQHVKKTTKLDRFEHAIKIVSKTASLPSTISRDVIDKLPESPGVYIFYNHEGAPLYIGKSINLKDRVLSHFAGATSDTKEGKIFRSIATLEVLRTDGELGALLEESKLIKLHKPLYNRQLREAERFVVLFKEQTSQGYFTVLMKEVSTIHPDELDNIIAVFRTHGQAKKHLLGLAASHKLCKKLLGIENTKESCFSLQLGTCSGACIGEEIAARYNLRFLEAFRKTKLRQWPFEGPIAIREGNSAHVVSHWCYVGKMTESDLESDQFTEKEYVFDYDTYKILSRYLFKKEMLQQVRVLKGM